MRKAGGRCADSVLAERNVWSGAEGGVCCIYGGRNGQRVGTAAARWDIPATPCGRRWDPGRSCNTVVVRSCDAMGGSSVRTCCEVDLCLRGAEVRGCVRRRTHEAGRFGDAWGLEWKLNKIADEHDWCALSGAEKK